MNTHPQKGLEVLLIIEDLECGCGKEQDPEAQRPAAHLPTTTRKKKKWRGLCAMHGVEGWRGGPTRGAASTWADPCSAYDMPWKSPVVRGDSTCRRRTDSRATPLIKTPKLSLSLFSRRPSDFTLLCVLLDINRLLCPDSITYLSWIHLYSIYLRDY